jgi:hypothetical protein
MRQLQGSPIPSRSSVHAIAFVLCALSLLSGTFPLHASELPAGPAVRAKTVPVDSVPDSLRAKAEEAYANVRSLLPPPGAIAPPPSVDAGSHYLALRGLPSRAGTAFTSYDGEATWESGVGFPYYSTLSANRYSGEAAVRAGASGMLAGVAAEAADYVWFYVGSTKTISVQGMTSSFGGKLVIGSPYAIAGTEITCMIDDDPNLYFRNSIDPPYDLDYWISVVLQFACVPPLDVYCGESIELAIQLLETVTSYVGLAEALNIPQVETHTVTGSFVASPGWHSVSVGLRTNASSSLLYWAAGEAGRVGQVAQLFIDNYAPPGTPTIAGPSSGTIGISYAFQIAATDPNGDMVKYRVAWGDGQATDWTGFYASGTPVTLSHTYAAAGYYEIQATAQDQDLLESPAASHPIATGVPPDTQPPDTQITSGPSGTIDYNDVTFTWTGTDNVTPPEGLLFSWRLEGYETSWSSYASTTSRTYTDLPNGSYTFRVKAKDQAGNIDPTPASRSFTVNVGTLYLIRPDGTGQYPTIQAAINAASNGWVIELANGTFTGSGNRDIDFLGKAITVRSQSGDPSLCTIDCQGSESDPHRGFRFHSGEGPSSALQGVTITSGYAFRPPGSGDVGGGILCAGSSPTITNCILSRNVATWDGGGMCCYDGYANLANCVFEQNSAQNGPYGGGGALCLSSMERCTVTGCSFLGNTCSVGGALSFSPSLESQTAELTDCVFSGNSASVGGALEHEGGHLTMTHCVLADNSATEGGAIKTEASGLTVRTSTFAGNRAVAGSSLYCAQWSAAGLENSILASGSQGAAVFCDGGTAILTCCDIWDNAGGDWVGCIADQYGANGNISADPMFCDPDNGDYRIYNLSPCAPAQQPTCGLIGALGVGCMQTIYTIRPNGTGTYPTIQAAVDAASAGTIIELTDGVFTGSGNRDVDFRGKAIRIRSQSRNPAACVIDCEGSVAYEHRGFRFSSGEGVGSVLEGLTIQRGHIRDGGGIYCYSSSPTILRCVLLDNEATSFGGGIYCENEASPVISSCTIAGNGASEGGGGIECYDSSAPQIVNTIIAFSDAQEAVHCAAVSSPTLSCCDLYGNAGGDWVGQIAGQVGTNGNIGLDPWFCDLAAGDVMLATGSNCAPEQAPPGCGLIGALGVGCEYPSGTPEPPVPSMLFLARPAPNPFSGETVLSYGIPAGNASARVSLEVVDPNGRVVRGLVNAVAGPGAYRVRWNGTDDRGGELPSGIYWLRMRVGNREMNERIVRIR